MPSIYIVQWRTVIGSGCLIGYLLVRREKINGNRIKENAIPLLISGVVLGCNWVCLFEAYKYTSVGIATIFYYLAPIIVFCVTPIIFKEKITKFQVIGILVAMVGMVFVNFTNFGAGDFSIYILYAVMAALLYATVMIANKFIKNMSGTESTMVQLVIACIVMSVYCFITSGKVFYMPKESDIFLVLIVGVVHTGIAYVLYIGAMQKLATQNIAIFSYLDPASALLFSFLFLGETMSFFQLFGAALILGGALFGSIYKS